MSVYVSREHRDLKEGNRRILEAFGPRLDFSKGVFLKPNVVFALRDNSGQITRRAVVQSLVEVLRELDDRMDIVIGEGTAAGTDPQHNFSVSGYSALAEKLGVRLLDLNEADRVRVPWEYGHLSLPRTALERIYVSLPILKCSAAAGISGAMKNQKGLLAPGAKKEFHRRGLHAPIAHLNRAIQPHLTIMDGSRFFRGRILIAGDNTYEVDALTVRLLDTPEPAYLTTARDLALAGDDFEILGDDLAGLKSTRRLVPRKYQQVGRLRLWSNPRACSMCRFLFRDLVRPTGGIYSSLLASSRLARHAFEGAEVVFGREPEFHAASKRVICVGDCTGDLAMEEGYIHIPGCPPSKKDLVRLL